MTGAGGLKEQVTLVASGPGEVPARCSSLGVVLNLVDIPNSRPPGHLGSLVLDTPSRDAISHKVRHTRESRRDFV